MLTNVRKKPGGEDEENDKTFYKLLHLDSAFLPLGIEGVFSKPNKPAARSGGGRPEAERAGRGLHYEREKMRRWGKQ